MWQERKGTEWGMEPTNAWAADCGIHRIKRNFYAYIISLSFHCTSLLPNPEGQQTCAMEEPHLQYLLHVDVLKKDAGAEVLPSVPDIWRMELLEGSSEDDLWIHNSSPPGLQRLFCKSRCLSLLIRLFILARNKRTDVTQRSDGCQKPKGTKTHC